MICKKFIQTKYKRKFISATKKFVPLYMTVWLLITCVTSFFKLRSTMQTLTSNIYFCLLLVHVLDCWSTIITMAHLNSCILGLGASSWCDSARGTTPGMRAQPKIHPLLQAETNYKVERIFSSISRYYPFFNSLREHRTALSFKMGEEANPDIILDGNERKQANKQIEFASSPKS